MTGFMKIKEISLEEIKYFSTLSREDLLMGYILRILSSLSFILFLLLVLYPIVVVIDIIVVSCLTLFNEALQYECSFVLPFLIILNLF